MDEEGGGGLVKFKFTCPLHVCDLCGKGRETGARSQLWPCWHCPKAYHVNCVPPTCKYHDYLLLCPDHAHLDLPHLPGWGPEDEADEGEVVGESLAATRVRACIDCGLCCVLVCGLLTD